MISVSVSDMKESDSSSLLDSEDGGVVGSIGLSSYGGLKFDSVGF